MSLRATLHSQTWQQFKMKIITTIITTILLTQMIYGQGFIPESPDTFKLKSIERKGNFGESLGYIYLKENYHVSSEQDSIIYYEWEPDIICAFKQDFEEGITYKVWQCKEAGGVSEQITFPRMENRTAREFIELLFYDRWNTWVSDLQYEPEGAGCYYKIDHSEKQTVIEIYCGC